MLRKGIPTFGEIAFVNQCGNDVGVFQIAIAKVQDN